ncbi:MAG: terminase TerL endonuclease subunit [Lachnospiraceae bacterium]
MVKNSKAYAYAKWCLDAGDYVPKYVKMQAKAWINIVDGKDEEAYADDEEYERVAKILQLIIHPDLHKPLIECIEFYAAFFIVAIFCTKLRDDEGRDIRYYQTALLEIARKNFKTFYSAVIFIILMITEPPNCRFFSVAPDLLKSSELKKAMKKIIKGSPTLVKEFKILRSEIRYNRNENEYMPLAYSKDNMDALLANAYLADEAGNMDEYPVEAMRSSQITLLNKTGIIISTQYPNDNNVMIDEIDVAKRTLDGLMEDKRYFALLYEPDDYYLQEDRWKSEDMVIYQSNPVAVWNQVIFDDIKKKRALAIQYPNKRENYLCKHNNIKYKGLGTEGYIDILKVKPCRLQEDVEWWKGRRVWLGVDLSQTDDNTAIAMVTEEDGIIYAKVWGFIPGDRIELKSEKENVDYARLIENGEVIACGEEVIDYSVVEDKILNLENEYGVEIVQIGYDRYNAISSVNKWEAAGYECVEIKQHSSVLHPATKLLREKILSKEFGFFAKIYNLLEINFSNARCTEDTNLNKYVNKKRSSGKVDMVVALINAIYLLQQEIEFGDSNFVVQT